MEEFHQFWRFIFGLSLAMTAFGIYLLHDASFSETADLIKLIAGIFLLGGSVFCVVAFFRQ
jgi:hypothetical protein